MRLFGWIVAIAAAAALPASAQSPTQLKPTKPTAAAKERRLEEKRRQAQTKRLRQPPGD